MSSTRGRLLAALAALAAVAAGCSDSPFAAGTACTPAAERSKLLATAQDWYLYQDLLPGTAQYQQLVPTPFDPGSFATPQDLLDGFTAAARAKNEDRGWSYLLTQAEAQQYFQAGQSAGYGYGYVLPASGPFAGKLVLTQVMRGSPADQAGFVRGDQILAVGSTAQTMTDVPTLVAQQTLGAALSGSTPGTPKSLSVLPRGQTTPVTRSMTSAVYDLDPVVSKVVASPLGKPVGYVLLRTFVTPAEQKLRDAFAAFNQQGVKDVLVDVRYDGGGLLATAQVLASLLHPAAGELMYRGQYNAKHTADSWTESFGGEASRLPAVDRVAFITTSGTASASELVPNALAAYLGQSLAVVGGRTYGKPVGQTPFPLGSCQDQLYLISFQLQNKVGFGGYYDGLPDAAGQFGGASCAADDDLTHDLGDPAETSTRQALAFVDGGAASCTAIPPATATAGAVPSGLSAARAAAVYPRPARPSPAQLEMPGLF